MAFHWNISVYYSLKIFRRFLWVPIPQHILYYRLALTIFKGWEQYTIDSMVYLIRNEFDPRLYA